MYLTSNKNKQFYSNKMKYQPTGQIANTTVVTKYESRWQLLQSYEYHIVSASIRKLRHCLRSSRQNLLSLVIRAIKDMTSQNGHSVLFYYFSNGKVAFQKVITVLSTR